MIKLVLLDYGRIVAPEDGDPVVQSVYGTHADDHASSRLFGDLRRDLAKGLLNETDVYERLKANGAEPSSDYEERWATNIKNHMYPVPRMLDLIKELKEAGYQVMLLSNVWPLSAKLIRENGWYEPFDKLFLSCDMGTAKPENAIYDAVLKDIPFTPEEVVFVDDKQDNLVYPEQRGMATIHADSPTDAVIKLRQFLNLTHS